MMYKGLTSRGRGQSCFFLFFVPLAVLYDYQTIFGLDWVCYARFTLLFPLGRVEDRGVDWRLARHVCFDFTMYWQGCNRAQAIQAIPSIPANSDRSTVEHPTCRQFGV